MKLRPYTPNDLPAVIEIFRSNIPKYFGPSEEPGLHEFLATVSGDVDRSDSAPRDIDYFVAAIGGDVVAAGGIALNEDETVSLCWGMVRAEHLGTGLGRELTSFRIERSLEKHGPLPMVIGTSQHTKGFYEKFGFRLISHTPDGFGPGIDNCKMRLDHPNLAD